MIQIKRNSGRGAAIKWAASVLSLSSAAAYTTTAAAASTQGVADCHSAAPVGNLGYPKLFMTDAQLGVAIACARTDLVTSLKTSAADLYANNWDKGAKPGVVGIGNDPELFHEFGNGEEDGSPQPTGVRQALITNPGDARMALRLATAAFFVDASTAANYRDLARLILLHWARHTMVDTPDNRVAARATPEFGLLVGSTSTAFGAAYDLLVAGGGMPASGDRVDMIAWFRDIGYLITESNNNWYNNCKIGEPFSFDGMSCERARGDNHVSVANAAIYMAGVFNNNATHKTKSVHNTDPGLNWGYNDRLTTVIYNGRNGGLPPAHQDQFRIDGGNIYINTGEIYDRWRGHYVERVRGLSLHRSIEYPMLNMTFMIAQAMAAKRQGLDLLAPIQKPDGKSISLGNAVNYYSFYLKAYNPGEHFSNRTGFLSEANYASLGYCMDGRVSSDPLETCPTGNPGYDYSYTFNYYHQTYAGAKFLFHGYPGGVEALIDPTVTETKMKLVGLPWSGHIIPFEPALYLEK